MDHQPRVLSLMIIASLDMIRIKKKKKRRKTNFDHKRRSSHSEIYSECASVRDVYSYVGTYL